MLCPKCKKAIPDDAVSCCYCQRRIVPEQSKRHRRPNGTGSVSKRKDRNTWEARVVDHYERTADGRLRPAWKTKGGFTTKRDAINYLPTLIASTPHRHDHPVMSFLENYERWVAMYASRVSAKTVEGYSGAFKHYGPLHHVKVDKISATDLQACIDKCPAGKRTKQLMKVVANLVFKYCIDDNQTAKNPAANLYIGDDETTHYDPLTEEELSRIASCGLPYSDYVVAMCYLGHRPAEFFGFRKSAYHEQDGIAFIAGGIKTKAGRERAVTIPPKVMPIIQRQLSLEDTDLLFPRIRQDKDGNPQYDQMPVRYFNKYVWQPLMAQLGIVGKVPYACRHTFANKIKRVSGDEKDKAGLMGHASYETTREHYQTTTLAEKQAITNQMQ